MMNSVSRKASRFLTAAALLAVASVFSAGAEAKVISLTGTHSASQIKTACGANGGSYWSNSQGYGCEGTGGNVNCTNGGRCQGYCEKCGTRQSSGGRIGIIGVLKPPTTSTHFYRAGTFKQPMATYQSFGRHK